MLKSILIHRYSVIIYICIFLFTINNTCALEMEEQIQICNSCHSKENISNDPSVPSILGQHFFYIYTQLKDYKAGRRKNDVMSVISEDLDKEMMKKLAVYYSNEKWIIYPNENSYNEEEVYKLLNSGGRNSCTKCHEGFIGLNGVPRLSGQKSSYLEKTMLSFKNKTRMNAPTKNSIFKDIDLQTIKIMSLFLSNYQ